MPACRTRTSCILAAGLALAGLLAGCQSPLGAPPPTGALTAAPPGQGSTCYAGVYVCTVPSYGPVGSSCVCPGIAAPSYGIIK